MLDPVVWLGWDRGHNVESGGACWVPSNKYDLDAQQRFTSNIGNHDTTTSRSHILRSSQSSLDAKDAAFLQCWLTFGLAESFLQTHLPDSALLTFANADAASTQKLTLLENGAWSLVSDFEDLSKEIKNGTVDQSEWFENARLSLLSCRDVLESLRVSSGPINGEIEILPLNMLAFVLRLAEILSCTLLELVEGDSNHAGVAVARDLLNWSRFASSVRLGYESELNTYGCFPRTLDCIGRLSLVSAWTYASSFHFDATQHDHAKCSSSICKHFHAVEGQYGVIHTIPNCNCTNVRPEKSDVFELLRAGKVPIFDIVWESEDLVTVIVQSSGERSYCAISHVWAEGLGSVTEFGLPTCQLARLHQGLGGQAFWIDSFGVPLDEEYRKMAIMSMAEIYREAKGVLVMDAALLKADSKTSSSGLLFQLYISNWLSRLWTLQEALLARNLVLGLKDKNVPFLDILKASFNQSIRPPLMKALCDRMMMPVPQLGSVTYTHDKGMSLAALASGLQSRCTSKPIDETVAISALAKVDAKSLLNLNRVDRMIHFLKCIHKLPTDIVFGRVHRLVRPGFSWAPQSLIQSSLRLTAPARAICTEGGIEATYNLVTFTKHTFKDQHTYHFITPEL